MRASSDALPVAVQCVLRVLNLVTALPIRDQWGWRMTLIKKILQAIFVANSCYLQWRGSQYVGIAVSF